MIEVMRSGSLTTIQDAGRSGYAHLGVTRSGALDQESFALANRLVGNRPGSAVLETTMDGIAIRFDETVWVAVTGAECTVSVGGSEVDWGLPVRVPTGQLLNVGAAIRGVRTYVAVAGGVDVKATLGSRSTDLLSGLGPAPLEDGDHLRVGGARCDPPAVDLAPFSRPDEELVLRVAPGPRVDWLARGWDGWSEGLTWTVAGASNRIGLRLDGPAVEILGGAEMPSEGIVLGSLQVPPSGQPVLFLNDHPTTGGYPVVAVVDPADLPACAQARPGTPVSLVPDILSFC